MVEGKNLQVAVQRRGSNGRWLTQEKEIAASTSLYHETALVLAAAAAVWKWLGSGSGCVLAGTWMTARLFSAYEREAAPGFGLLGNLVTTVIRVLRHVSGGKLMQWLQEDSDVRMEKHLATVRQQTEKMMSSFQKEEVEKVEDFQVKVRDGTEIAIRLVFPKQEKVTGSLPALAFYCHGGAFVAQSPKSMEFFARQAANSMSAVVAVPNYRLAPEFKFPTAHTDCVDAFSAVLNLCTSSTLAGKVDLSKIAIFGDSAGGHLAAHLAFCLSRPRSNGRKNTADAIRLPEGCRLKAAILFCPVVTPYSPTGSHVRLCNGPLIGEGLITWMWNHYLNDPLVEMHHPSASLLLDDNVNFGGECGDSQCMPSTVVVTAHFDPLCDEGEQLAAKIAENMHRCRSKSTRVYCARRLEAHCFYHPSTSSWAFAAGRALLNDENVPEAPTT